MCFIHAIMCVVQSSLRSLRSLLHSSEAHYIHSIPPSRHTLLRDPSFLRWFSFRDKSLQHHHLWRPPHSPSPTGPSGLEQSSRTEKQGSKLLGFANFSSCFARLFPEVLYGAYRPCHSTLGFAQCCISLGFVPHPRSIQLYSARHS